MRTWEACRLDPSLPVAIIGGGGKTTVLFQLAEEAGAHGLAGTITTTTRMWMPGPLSAGWDFRCRGEEGQKAVGLSPTEVDALERRGVLLIEADGSRGRPLKVHGTDEPVVPASCFQVVAVLGMSALGASWGPEVAHRAELLSAGEITVEILVEVLERMLARVDGRTVTLLLNQADLPERVTAARQIASRFRERTVVARSHAWLERL